MSWQENLEKDLRTSPEAFKDLVKVIAKLRHPENGCPWDLKQDHKSLRRFMLEEAYEAAEAMGGSDRDHLREELGDVLLQVVLNSQVLADEGEDGITEVIKGITEKMVRRHPHVFSEDFKEVDVEEVKRNWSAIKASEKVEGGESVSIFHREKKTPFPALMQAYKIGKRAHEIKFDWDGVEPVWEQFLSEVKELEDEILSGVSKERILDEMGDVFFSLAQVCRHLNIDPEVAAMGGNLKFLSRFELMESLAKEEGLDIVGMAVDQMEGLWQQAKAIKKAAIK